MGQLLPHNSSMLLPHNSSMLTRRKKTLNHELGGGEYWNYEAFGRKLMGALDVITSMSGTQVLLYRPVQPTAVELTSKPRGGGIFFFW